jgi:hypothetical protein
MDVSTRYNVRVRGPSGCNHCRTRYRRSGYAERYDSGNEDCSPDAHDSSKAIPEVSDRFTGGSADNTAY